MHVNAPTDRPRAALPDPRVALAAQGDRAAAQALLAELLPRVRNLVRYLASGDSEVDDVAQKVLVQLMRSFQSYRGEGSLRAWCDRITVRVAISHLRKRRDRERQTREIGPDLYAVSSDPGQPDDYLLRREAVRWLDALPREQREVVVLHHVVGLSAPELAEQLGIPFETARSRLRLGMSKLRENLERSESKKP
jgi:RNA polymerase sigma-70 factor (ECF subfamily)